jgi:hypothetical protein
MKKWVLFICALLVAALACIYLFIPSTAVVSRTVMTKGKAGAVFKILRKEGNWNDWWPSGKGNDTAAAGAARAAGGMGAGAGEQLYFYRGLSYRVTQLSYQVINIRIGEAATGYGDGTVGHDDGTGGYQSRLSIITLGSIDSILLQWECPVSSGGLNPVRRVQQYLFARKIAGNMSEILNSLSGFLGKRENVYGVAIREGSTTDSCLLTTRSIFPADPSTDDIYRLLHRVRDYLEQEGAKQTSYPMMNITPMNGQKDSFRVMVAIPVDRSLPGKGDITFMRLIPGRYLIADVKGGKYSIDRALEGFQDYILDYQRTIMAIPFQSLVTDRSQEPDTSRWETRIYYPIF